MIRVSKESGKLPGEVISEALTFFGAGGEGLERSETTATAVTFTGAGGFGVG